SPPDLVNRGPVQRVQDEPSDVLGGLLATMPQPAPDAASTNSVLVGVWVLAVIVGLLAIAFGAHPAFVFVLGFWLARLLRNLKDRAALTRTVAALGRHEVRPSRS